MIRHDHVWAVGQEVWWAADRHFPAKTARVTKVGKLKITLDDGSEWKASSGRRWADSFRDLYLRLLDDEGRERMRRHEERREVAQLRRGLILRLEDLHSLMRHRLSHAETVADIQRVGAMLDAAEALQVARVAGAETGDD